MTKIITTGGTISSGASAEDASLATVNDTTRMAFEESLKAVFGDDTQH